MSSTETPAVICENCMATILHKTYKQALSERIKAGIRRKRELQAKQLNHD